MERVLQPAVASFTVVRGCTYEFNEEPYSICYRRVFPHEDDVKSIRDMSSIISLLYEMQEHLTNPPRASPRLPRHWANLNLLRYLIFRR